MSKSAAHTHDAEPEQDADTEDARETEDAPDIEEDLVSEKLRIDGICGVY